MDNKDWIPQKGCWIMIRNTIPTEVFIPPLSIWYAVPSNKETFPGERMMGWSHERAYSDTFLGRTDREIKLLVKTYHIKKSLLTEEEKHNASRIISYHGNLQRQMKIKTPFGDCCIEPEEYSVVNDLNKYLDSVDDGSVQIKHISSNKDFRGKLNDQIFYLRSRGIPLSTALMMVSGNIQTQNAFYLLFHPEYIKMFCRNYDIYSTNKERLISKMKKQNKGDMVDHYLFDEVEALKLNRKYNKSA